MQTLILYDIGNDKLRDKIIYLCQEAGANRIQYSVFIADLDEYEKEILIEKINKTIQEYLPTEDTDDKNRQLQVHIFSLCNIDANKIKLISRNGITYYTPTPSPNLIII